MGRVDAIAKHMGEAPIASVEIPSLEGRVPEEEWKVRVDRAAAYRQPGTCTPSTDCRSSSLAMTTSTSRIRGPMTS